MHLATVKHLLMETKNMPPLPKQHKDPEAKFGIEFRKWLKENCHGEYDMRSCSLELKHTRGRASLPFDEVKPEQLAYASQIEGNGALIRVQGLKGEPDYIWLTNATAWIVVRYRRFWCMIEAQQFVWERDKGKSKSLSEERARAIASIIVEV